MQSDTGKAHEMLEEMRYQALYYNVVFKSLGVILRDLEKMCCAFV